MTTDPSPSQGSISTGFGDGHRIGATTDRRTQLPMAMPVIDGSPENLRAALEGTLKRLGTDYIDLGLSVAPPEMIHRAHAVHPIAALQSDRAVENS